MYMPRHFAEGRLDVAHAIMHDYPFASLVTGGGGGLVASHLPLLVDTTHGSLGTLQGHLARANPHWEQFDGKTQALVIFQGPNAYISPAWYIEQERTVPTWNYVTVHAYGRPVVIDAPDRRLAILRRLVERFETGLPDSWTLDRTPPGYVDALSQGIVAFAIEVERIEAKVKASQNRPADRASAAAVLAASGSDVARDMARWMRMPIDEPPA